MNRAALNVGSNPLLIVHNELFWTKVLPARYRDVKGLSETECWHDMKSWWPYNEAIVGTLLAYMLIGEAKYGRWHQMVHQVYAHFPDPLHGEWCGYLHV